MGAWTQAFRKVSVEECPSEQGGGRFLHETLLTGSRNALERPGCQKMQEIAIFWGPPHDEPFCAVRQHSATRGEALF